MRPFGTGTTLGALGHRAGTGGCCGWRLPKLSSFCNSHGMTRKLLGTWGTPSPGTPSQAHCGIHGKLLFNSWDFFSLLIWVMHNQNKHTEEKPTQPEGLFLSRCVQLTCGVASVVLGCLRCLSLSAAPL